MTNLSTDEIVFYHNLTKIGTDENKAIYSIYSDSLSCLQTLQNRNLEHPVIREIVHLLTYLNSVGT